MFTSSVVSSMRTTIASLIYLDSLSFAHNNVLQRITLFPSDKQL